jgi:formylglycine-generating enzyme required for sulfatase activity
MTNKWGLKDTNGNVWEWCEGLHVDTLPRSTDTFVTRERGERWFRGGSWLDATAHCWSVRRG